MTPKRLILRCSGVTFTALSTILSSMRDSLKRLWPRLKTWLFIGTIGALLVTYGLLSNDDLPAAEDRFSYISGEDYIELLKRDTDKTMVIDVRTEHAPKDEHANALVQGVAYEEMGRELAEQSGELKDKNLVFM